MIVTGIDTSDGRFWHLLAEPVELSGTVEASVDAAFRDLMCQLHTDAHILNALVYQQFQGALVTGAQLNDDGTARMDFDLPDADNDRLRALEPAINDAIRQDLPVRYAYLPAEECHAESRPAPEPLGGAAAGRRRHDPHRRDRRPRPPGLRRHAPGVDGRLAAASASSRSTTRAATTAGSASASRG